MSKEAMKLALEALYNMVEDGDVTDKRQALEAITALREALAQQALDKKAENARELGLDYEPAQQEPVDFASLLREAEELVREKPTWKRFIEGTPLSNDIAVWMTMFAQDVARRTSPPAQRTWVGLTDEERIQFVYHICNLEPYFADPLDAAVCAIEAKLKEKNT